MREKKYCALIWHSRLIQIAHFRTWRYAYVRIWRRFHKYLADREKEKEKKITFIRLILVRWSFDFNNDCHSQNREMCFFLPLYYLLRLRKQTNRHNMGSSFLGFFVLSVSLLLDFVGLRRRYLHISTRYTVINGLNTNAI